MSFSIETYKKVLESSSEVQVFIILNGMNTRLLETNIAVRKGLLDPSRKLESDVSDLKDLIRIGMAETTRFGVKDPLIVDDQVKSNNPLAVIFTPSPQYWQWYSFWETWKNSLTQTQWAEVDEAITEDLPTVPHLPSMTWQA